MPPASHSEVLLRSIPGVSMISLKNVIKIFSRNSSKNLGISSNILKGNPSIHYFYQGFLEKYVQGVHEEFLQNICIPTIYIFLQYSYVNSFAIELFLKKKKKKMRSPLGVVQDISTVVPSFTIFWLFVPTGA